MTRGVQRLDDDGAEGEAGVVGGRLGDGVGVFAADYGELLVGVLGELAGGVSIDSGKGLWGSVRSCGFPRRGHGGWTLVLDWSELVKVMRTYWWVLMIAVRLISPDFTRGLKVGITLQYRGQYCHHRKIGKLPTYSAVYAGSIMTASLVFSSTTRYA